MAMTFNQPRPENHVTKELAERLTEGHKASPDGVRLPILGPREIAALKALYPQRCIGRHEDPSDFLWYSAKAELVRELEHAHDNAPSERETTRSPFEQMMEENILAADALSMEYIGGR